MRRKLNPSGRDVVIGDARGTVCWDLQGRGAEGCNGPHGSPTVAGRLDKEKPAGALITKSRGGRTYFSVNGECKDNEGYFEFDVTVP